MWRHFREATLILQIAQRFAHSPRSASNCEGLSQNQPGFDEVRENAEAFSRSYLDFADCATLRPRFAKREQLRGQGQNQPGFDEVRENAEAFSRSYLDFADCAALRPRFAKREQLRGQGQNQPGFDEVRENAEAFSRSYLDFADCAALRPRSAKREQLRGQGQNQPGFALGRLPGHSEPRAAPPSQGREALAIVGEEGLVTGLHLLGHGVQLFGHLEVVLVDGLRR